jgi:hypothetical protein
MLPIKLEPSGMNFVSMKVASFDRKSIHWSKFYISFLEKKVYRLLES